MAITNTRLTSINPTTVFTADGQQAITTMYICNTSNSPVSFNLFIINSSDSVGASNDNMAYSTMELQANDSYVISNERLVLSDGDLIDVEANIADCVTVTVSSIEV